MKGLIVAEMAFLVSASALLWYGGLGIGDIISFITASSVGFYIWNKGTSAVLRKLGEAAANSPEKAVKPEAVGITWEGFYLDFIAEKTEDGRYYLSVKKPIEQLKGVVQFLRSRSGAAAALGISLALASTLTPIQTIPIVKELTFFTGLAILIYGLAISPRKK